MVSEKHVNEGSEPQIMSEKQTEGRPKATSENIEALIASNTNSTLPAGKLNSHDGDEALKAFLNREGPPLVIDEATNKRLLRRIDLHLMPVRCF